MQAIRTAAQKEKDRRARNAEEGIEDINSPDIQESWAQSLDSMISILRTRFERLVLKEKQVFTTDLQFKNVIGFFLVFYFCRLFYNMFYVFLFGVNFNMEFQMLDIFNFLGSNQESCISRCN